MLIDLKDISRGTAAVIPLNTEISPQDMLFSYQGYSLTGQLTLEGSLHHSENGVIRLNGRLRAELTGECSRCLRQVTFNLDQAIVDWFRPARPGAEATTVTEALDENSADDLYYGYSGRQIDIGQVIRDEMVLALPQRVLCTVTCRGLCPVCGQDLNQKVCGCDKSENREPSPFDRLKELL